VAARGERGIALMLVVMAILLVSVLAGAVVLTGSTEAMIAAGYRSSQETFYAADAAAEWAFAELTPLAPQWDAVVQGTLPSAFIDPAPLGEVRRLADGSSVDLSAVAAANAGWRIYAYGRLAQLVSTSPGSPSPCYVVVLVSEDAALPEQLKLRAIAFGTRASRRTVQLVLLRRPGMVLVDSWEELR
jgi:hypothetical protein